MGSIIFLLFVIYLFYQRYKKEGYNNKKTKKIYTLPKREKVKESKKEANKQDTKGKVSEKEKVVLNNKEKSSFKDDSIIKDKMTFKDTGIGTVEEFKDMEDLETNANDKNIDIGDKLLKNPKEAFLYSEIFNRKY